jgi:hypothetical protein
VGLLRLFDATFLASDSRPNAIRRERYQLMRRMRLWKEEESRQPNQHTLWPNVFLYDPVFANDIRTGAIPTDFQSVLALSENMGALSCTSSRRTTRTCTRGSARLTVPFRCSVRLGSWRRSVAASGRATRARLAPRYDSGTGS